MVQIVPVDIANPLFCSLEIQLGQTFFRLKDELEVCTRLILRGSQDLDDKVFIRGDERQGYGDSRDGVTLGERLFVRP